MPKLHQVLAVERDVKQTTNRRITDGYQILQKPVLLSGLAKTYQSKEEDGDQYPPESQLVQVRAIDVLHESQSEFERLWDMTATKDWANLTAIADVTLEDGTVLMQGAPTTYLLWLEKQLNDLHTVFSKLPTLDPTEQWMWSPQQNCFVTGEQATFRTKKLPRVLVKAPATDKHQADTEVWHEDIVVGTWTTVKYSGALRATEKRALLDRVNEVRAAVKTARSRANEAEIENMVIAATTLDYLFAPLQNANT